MTLIYAGSRPTVGVLRSWTANEEVVGFDVAVDEVLLVDRLHSADLQGGERAKLMGV